MSSGNDRWAPTAPDTRRRHRDDDRPRRDANGDRPRRDAPPAAKAAPSRPERPSDDRPVRAERPAPKAPVAPEFPTIPAPKLATDDLLALAQLTPEEMAELMAGNMTRKRVEVGARVTGSVTRVGKDTVFVDLGGKSEGQIDRVAVPDVKPGDELTAYVSGMGEQGIELALTLAGRAAAEHLEDARESGAPVEGKVMSRNAGGFEVRVGSVRAFCPASLMSRLPEVDMDTFVGQSLQFKVVETGDKVVLSRRALQEAEVEAKAGELWKTLEIGQQHRGTVRSVQEFGFFVDLGGLDGLVPRREISWAGGADPRTAVRMGQAVEVAIIDLDFERRKITLSVKALESDPWSHVGSTFTEGGVYPGTVMRAEPFGCFVELAPGLQGLIHVSKLGAGAPEVGTTLDVRLLAIDPERRRLELSPAAAGEVSAATPADTPVQGTVLEVLRNGVSVQLVDGRVGWLPENEADLPAGTVLAQRFRRGKTVQARIVKDDSRKPTLSVREALDEDERSWRSHQARSGGPKAAAAGFGTFGDLLSGLKVKK